MAAATFTDLQYQLKRVYGNRNYVADLALGMDTFLGSLKKGKVRKTGGQSEAIPVSYDGAGIPSNTDGTTGTASPSRGVQFLVTPVQLTNLASLGALAAAAGASDVGALVKSVKFEIDSAIKKVGKHAAIQIWSDGYPALGQIKTAGASTTLELIDHDDVNKFSVGDIIVGAAARTTGGLRAGSLTVTALQQSAGTMTVGANTNTVLTSSDYLFLQNTRAADASKIGITGIPGWSAGGASFFSVNTTIDDRLHFLQTSASAADIEGAFIDGIAYLSLLSNNGVSGLKAYANPRTWATLAKALQSRTIASTPTTRKARDGQVTFSGFQVMTPSGVIELYTTPFVPKSHIYIVKEDTFSLLNWGLVEFPGMIANSFIPGAPAIIMDPATGVISAAVGGFPQLACDAPGLNLDITLT